MATEEVSKPTSLPLYQEMILNALDELNEEGGSSKSAISNHIQSTHGELPEDHSKLLSDHLNMMKENNEIIFFKNNYMRFDPEAPPKRGRGRPKKDPNAPPAPKKTKTSEVSGTGRPRGRPPKNKDAESGGVSSEGEKEKSGRPRGRPPKAKPQQAQVGVQDG